MRGRTFNDCYVIADEFQNSLQIQMKMLLTRIGTNCKLVITGDVKQHDRTGCVTNGLTDFIERYKNYNQPNDKIKIIEFKKSDIQRNPLIGDILEYYGEN